MDYSIYFDKLNVEVSDLSSKKLCCNNQEILIIDNTNVCENCGLVIDDNLYENMDNEKFKNVYNPKFALSTKIEYKSKYKSLYRLQKWTSYDYKENTANNSYNEIKKIGKIFNIETTILDNACCLYNDIYMKQQISSRNKIKRSIYIYCIYKSCLLKNIYDIDLLEMIEKNNLTIDNFNNAIIKLNDKNYLIHKDIKKFIKLTKEHYDIDLTSYDIIKNYNVYLNKNTKKINKNSLLIYIFYIKIKPKNIKNFIDIFGMSRLTLTKIINKLYNELN